MNQFSFCIIFCKLVFDLDLKPKNLNHFTGIWKRFKVTVNVPSKLRSCAAVQLA